MRKLTIEFVREVLSERNIELLSETYVGAHEKLKVRCMKDSHEWSASWANLQQGKGCPACAGLAAPTIEYIREVLKNRNIELLSDSYVNNSTKLKLRCLQDGHIWSARWNNLRQGQGCPKCAGQLKPTIKHIREFLKNKNIELLSESYKDSHTKLELRCMKDNHEWEARWNDLRQGKGCPKCAGLAVPTLECIREFLKNRNIQLLTNTYTNAHSKLKVRCMKDNHEWSATWTNLYSNNTGCPLCAKGSVSRAEIAFREWVAPECPYEVVANNRKILNGKELDIWIPELNIAIEYNGNYHHKFPEKEFEKKKLAKSKGILLIFVYDDQYKEHQYFYRKALLPYLNEKKKA